MRGGGGVNPKADIDLFLIEKKKQDVYLQWCESHLHKVFSFPHIFGKVRFLNKFWKRRVLNNPNLINYFIKTHYDINIGFLEGISSIYISQKRGGKKIGYIHTELDKLREGKRDEKECRAYLALDGLICVSHSAKQSLLRLYPELAHKHIEVIYNPINKDDILHKANLKAIPKSTFVFAQIGRLTHQKGCEVLLKANKILQDKGYKYEIWFIGEGVNHQRELEALIVSQQVSNVRFLGFQDNPYAYLKACDVKISASYYEGFSLVLAEACVLGKPIIASDIATSKEILYDEALGECGMFFESGNAGSLALAMERMYKDKMQREVFAHRAFAHSKIFDITTSVKQLERFLGI